MTFCPPTTARLGSTPTYQTGYRNDLISVLHSFCGDSILGRVLAVVLRDPG